MGGQQHLRSSGPNRHGSRETLAWSPNDKTLCCGCNHGRDPRRAGTLLASINVGALMEHHVYRDEELVMCSYDGLACCWLGKSINHEVLKDASRTQGFHFTDTEDV